MREKKPKYTHGPWQWDGNDLWHFGISYTDAENPHVYTGITSDRKLAGSPRLEANRVLTAAAPELFEAGRGIHDFLAQWCENTCFIKHCDVCDLRKFLRIIERLEREVMADVDTQDETEDDNVRR